MRHVLFALLILTLLLTGCSSPYTDPNLPSDFPSSPSLIVEENGWKSLLIVPQRRGDGKEVTFDNPVPRDSSESWYSTGLIFSAGSNNLASIVNYCSVNCSRDDVSNNYSWLYKVDTSGAVITSKKLENHVNLLENNKCFFGFENDSSLYWWIGDSIYKDSQVLTSYEPLKTVNPNCYDLRVGPDNSLLIKGRYYFNWQNQIWCDVKPKDMDEKTYRITQFKDQNHLIGLSEFVLMSNENSTAKQFLIKYQELDLSNSVVNVLATNSVSVPDNFGFTSVNGNISNTGRKIYLAAYDINAGVVNIYLFDVMSGKLEVKSENIILPNYTRDVSVNFAITEGGKTFYYARSKIYFLDSSLKFIDITPKKVEEEVGITSIFAFGERIHVSLAHQFRNSLGESVTVSQIAYYEAPNQ